jgi:protein-S-isoprenylcysteine O-methyltransferase Ste14
MALADSFEKSGNFLFRYRGHIPLIVFVLAIPVAFFTPYAKLYSIKYFKLIDCILTLTFISTGHLIRARTVGRRFLQTSGRNRSHQVASNLNTTGWYSIVRHPLYLGNALIWLGIACFLENIWFVVILMLLFWIYYERIMFAEEQFLERKFGNQFIEWSEKVPAFFPSFNRFKPATAQFSWKVVFKNEYPGLLSTMTSLLFVLILKRCVLYGTIHFILKDLYIALFILTFGLIFKGIKKYTSLFEPMD